MARRKKVPYPWVTDSGPSRMDLMLALFDDDYRHRRPCFGMEPRPNLTGEEPWSWLVSITGVLRLNDFDEWLIWGTAETGYQQYHDVQIRYSTHTRLAQGRIMSEQRGAFCRSKIRMPRSTLHYHYHSKVDLSRMGLMLALFDDKHRDRYLRFIMELEPGVTDREEQASGEWYVNVTSVKRLGQNEEWLIRGLRPNSHQCSDGVELHYSTKTGAAHGMFIPGQRDIYFYSPTKRFRVAV